MPTKPGCGFARGRPKPRAAVGQGKLSTVLQHHPWASSEHGACCMAVFFPSLGQMQSLKCNPSPPPGLYGGRGGLRFAAPVSSASLHGQHGSPGLSLIPPGLIQKRCWQKMLGSSPTKPLLVLRHFLLSFPRQVWSARTRPHCCLAAGPPG